ncbi:MAG TPA: hypothetical protein VFX59_19325 [Polyangiales bacterium]|nr:hypothetical protein [Polyangiales bacterium]
MSDAIAAQNLHELMKSWSGASPYAWKVAINGERGQRRLGLTHFVIAPLRERIHLTSGIDVEFAPAQKICVEAEVLVRIARDDGETGESLIEAVAPCLEIVDYALGGTSLRELLAHSFFHAGIVPGKFIPAAEWRTLRAPYPRAQDDQGNTHARESADDDLTELIGEVAALARAAGAPLRRGQLVLSGSYIEPLPLRLGTTVEVDYGPELPKLSVGRTS